MQMVIYSALKDVGVIMSVNFPSGRIECSRMLAEELNILLRVVPCFVDIFSAFVRTAGELFRFVLDLGM